MGHDRGSRHHRYRAGLRRWPRRTLIGVLALLVVLILLAIATFTYAFWRYHELDRTAVSGLVAVHPGAPFDVLIVGATAARSTASENQRGAKQLASVILLARVDPKSHDVRIVAVPPDTEVAIANASAPIKTGPIDEALEAGPGPLVQTIEAAFHVPITDYVALELAGVGSVVGALGGIHLDFAYPVRDEYTGLSIDKSGCQLVSGSQTQALFQSQHLYYFANGAWRADLRGTPSVIARESAIFAATVTSTGGIGFDPVELNNFVSAAVANLTIDNVLSESKLLSLAETFRGFSPSQLASRGLPMVEARSSSGRTVLAPAAAADDSVLRQLLALGTIPSGSSLIRRVHVVVPAGLSVPSHAPLVDETRVWFGTRRPAKCGQHPRCAKSALVHSKRADLGWRVPDAGFSSPLGRGVGQAGGRRRRDDRTGSRIIPRRRVRDRDVLWRWRRCR